MSIINNVNRLRKLLSREFRVCWIVTIESDASGWSYIFLINRKNQTGRLITIYMPVKHPGETGPKPMIANNEKTERHFICATFIVIYLVDRFLPVG